MGSFKVIAQSYVLGITITAIEHVKDGSWSLQVNRTNFAEEDKLGPIATVTLVPAQIVDPDKQHPRNMVEVPETCSEVLVYVGAGTIATDESRDLLGMVVLDAANTGPDDIPLDTVVLGPL